MRQKNRLLFALAAFVQNNIAFMAKPDAQGKWGSGVSLFSWMYETNPRVITPRNGKNAAPSPGFDNSLKWVNSAAGRAQIALSNLNGTVRADPREGNGQATNQRVNGAFILTPSPVLVQTSKSVETTMEKVLQQLDAAWQKDKPDARSLTEAGLLLNVGNAIEEAKKDENWGTSKEAQLWDEIVAAYPTIKYGILINSGPGEGLIVSDRHQKVAQAAQNIDQAPEGDSSPF